MKIRQFAGALLLAGSLAACSSMPGGSPHGYSSARSGFGVVESVQTVNSDSPGILGTIGGAVVGGLLGHQIGSGTGQTAATIAGAAGGAYAGREVERRARGGDSSYKILVRMEDGTYQTVEQERQPGLRAGDRVRVEGGVVTPY